MTRDPVAALQQLADRRAAALTAADPILLMDVDASGSSLATTDLGTIDRLRQQRQRYAELAFLVRSAEVVSAASDVVVLRAVVDRSAYRVLTEGADSQQVGPAPGTALRYSLAMADGTWRFDEVSAP